MESKLENNLSAVVSMERYGDEFSLGEAKGKIRGVHISHDNIAKDDVDTFKEKIISISRIIFEQEYGEGLSVNTANTFDQLKDNFKAISEGSETFCFRLYAKNTASPDKEHTLLIYIDPKKNLPQASETFSQDSKRSERLESSSSSVSNIALLTDIFEVMGGKKKEGMSRGELIFAIRKQKSEAMPRQIYEEKFIPLQNQLKGLDAEACEELFGEKYEKTVKDEVEILEQVYNALRAKQGKEPIPAVRTPNTYVSPEHLRSRRTEDILKISSFISLSKEEHKALYYGRLCASNPELYNTIFRSLNPPSLPSRVTRRAPDNSRASMRVADLTSNVPNQVSSTVVTRPAAAARNRVTQSNEMLRDMLKVVGLIVVIAALAISLSERKSY